MERPILFSASMVQAIFNGAKTQTRRVCKPEHFGGSHMPPESALMRARDYGAKLPYGDIGDLLWVRETWLHDSPHCDDHKCGNPDHIYYRATEQDPSIFPRWRPSIFMQRWASRITLEITDFRVERIQEISEADAKAEGVAEHKDVRGSFTYAYAQLWDALNAKRGFGWKFNPWVWVVVFRLVETAD